MGAPGRLANAVILCPAFVNTRLNTGSARNILFGAVFDFVANIIVPRFRVRAENTALHCPTVVLVKEN